MEATEYFKRTLFYDRSPAANEYYERSAERIFEKNSSKTQIDVHVQFCNDDSQCKGNNKDEPSGNLKHTGVFENHREKEHRNGQRLPLQTGPDVQHAADGGGHSISYEKDSPSGGHRTSDEDDSWSLSSQTSSTALPSGMDQRQADSGPPLYPGLPKLAFTDIKPSEIESFVERTKLDFRVFYLRQRHSYSRLQITKEEFERLLASCHVFPRFSEYVIGFGIKTSELEVGPPPLKFRPICTSYGNQYRGFECAYILRYVERTNRPGERKPWSLRQFAVYHRFKPSLQSRCSTWILVGASERTVTRLDQYARSVDDLIDANPIELHAIFLDTVITSWRPYLSYLTQLVSEQSSKASGVSIRIEKEEEESFVSINVEDHQQLKQIEDYVADLILCLDSTSDTLTTLREMYEQHCEHQQNTIRRFQNRTGSAHTDAVAVALTEKAKEITYTRRKAESLLSKVQNTRTLISSLLERQSGCNIDQQIAALQQLEQQ
ncbi:hypothetical protein ST47_g5218 [Ascochyta rabiei]|uniref:CorA-like transporter domain-containing protein n=1 Tax=Didymella rabiei TaxID=5454 RepID=A0A163EBP7_DIDRA|nr:hypothetical protein ST47_g5218 [Ascochyta rabiei]